ncbi:MAG: hypothetical protein GY847_02415 [Proteobacteria bacterium]|nr:hypothetical protein [Pseudomonadota bacterium]
MSLTLRQICLVAEKIQPVIDDLKNVLGIEVCYVDPSVEFFGLENALLPVSTNFIEVVAPIQENTTAERYLQRRGGDGGYMVITQADSAEDQKAVRKQAAKMGIRVAFETEYETAHVMQLHPGDTGGSFLQVDWDTENDHKGHWVFAGGTGWKEFIKRDTVTKIMAAELQSPDPMSLAHRWSSITYIPLQMDTNANLILPLNNAVIRFVEETDGRGEGLGAIDIKATNRKKALEAAEERGLRTSDNQVMICGLRINLS